MREVAPVGFLFLVLTLAAIIAVRRGATTSVSVLFAGEPLCLLSGPSPPLILLAHFSLLGIFLEMSGGLTGQSTIVPFVIAALVTLPFVLLMPFIHPLLTIGFSLTLTGLLGALAFFSALRLRVRSRGDTP